jgi:hypothetical protein
MPSSATGPPGQLLVLNKRTRKVHNHPPRFCKHVVRMRSWNVGRWSGPPPPGYTYCSLCMNGL